MKGREAGVRGTHLLATNGKFHGQIVGLFGEVFAGQYRVPLPQIHQP